MQIRRGNVVLVGGADAHSSPRPFAVVQSDNFNDHHASVSLCPITSRLNGAYLFRVAIAASEATGLDRNCEIQIDRIQRVARGDILRVLGTLPAETMTMVDDALRRWLQL